MKRRGLAFLFVFLLTMPCAAVYADAPKASLDHVDVKIEVKDGVYAVQEHVTLQNPSAVPDGKLEHTFSHINGVKSGNIKFLAGGQELGTEVQGGEAMDRIFIQLPADSPEVLEYTIQYQAEVPQGQYALPLVVPMYKVEKSENHVQISFQAPEGNVIQANSFPVVNHSGENHVTSNMVNVPSHVSYIFGTEETVFHSHNLISAITLLVLLGILLGWGAVERKNARKGA
ncbi:hypothetical protein NDK47_07455 [Brevibacillus ruminantium]|uniref:Uncharacterized protein n=1 Tax=Brevibacillus ruminantium TaxID=2950604 RepID=A0ABY4WJT2_9BACL|nr:hypothetical protein [Brevibacillus ruminantium]USG67119.1 hypothetical protein NDK47_07455 [Brevibacillus ruminantium]